MRHFTCEIKVCFHVLEQRPTRSRADSDGFDHLVLAFLIWFGDLNWMSKAPLMSPLQSKEMHLVLTERLLPEQSLHHRHDLLNTQPRLRQAYNSPTPTSPLRLRLLHNILRL